VAVEGVIVADLDGVTFAYAHSAFGMLYCADCDVLLLLAAFDYWLCFMG
jgi:hypothetical protein